ncbi:tannase and feruloyl esterase [Thozetella sp. PMI_491]|nr:tannase and feruloyl esterase [Thozetella sp. PMI_491]
MVHRETWLAAIAVLVDVAQSTTFCSQLLFGWAISNSTEVIINIAAQVEGGTTFVGNTTGILATSPTHRPLSYNLRLPDLPAHCRVAAQFNTSSDSTVNFEIWMPDISQWNGRFLAVGNGGWAGASQLKDFATMSTNGGHNSTSDDGTWFQYPEQSIDYGHRAMHLSVVHAKTILSHYYGVVASWAYYMGCSTGGRQGFAEVQRYPDDFDGALVGSPVIWQTHEEAYEDWAGIGFYPNTLDTFISTTQWSKIHEEALHQCDHIDGVRDGIISDPPSCNFVPETLLCKGNESDADSCLTAPQLANLKRLYGDWVETNNTLVWPGVPLGAELTGIQYYTNAEIGGGYGLDFYRYAILNDTQFQSTDITYEDVLTAEKINSYGGISDAFDPDLSAFEARGGKILHYHGWQDSVVNTPISILYYNKVMSHFADAAGTGPRVSVPDFYRLFMVPGLGHCSGGDGAWALGTSGQLMPPLQNDTLHSALLALVQWTEGGKAPEVLVGTRYVNETTEGDQALDLTVDFTRPSCRWPSVPKFRGGNVNNASHWICPPNILD